MAYSTTPMTDRPRYPVNPPLYTPYRRYGLLACAPIVPGEDGARWEQGVEYWSDSCDLTTGYVDGWCAPEGEEWDKEIHSFDPTRVIGDPFTVTSGLACNSPVFPAADRARELLARGEDLQAEAQFWRQQMARDDLTDLGTDGAVLALDDAIAVIEAEAARRYAGQLFIHVPVHAISRLLYYRLADTSGPCLRTAYGSAVIAGAGYTDRPGPDSEDPPANGFWILATGQVQIRRSDVFTQPVFDPKKNRMAAIAERTYVITGDCFAAAVKSSPCACTPTADTGGNTSSAPTTPAAPAVPGS